MSSVLRLAEVGFGEAYEEPILVEWKQLSPSARKARGFIKGGRFDDFDFIILEKSGLVILYLEVKQRRVKFADYGDAMFPLRKHELALEAKRRGTSILAVTRYACGSLVEVDLSTVPSRTADVTRRDRPGKSVPHVFYSGRKLRLLRGAS